MLVQRDSRGVIHPLMVVLLVVVIAAIGFAGYKVMNNNKDKTSSTGTVKTVNNTAVLDSCSKVLSDKNICNFASHYNPKAPYKAVATSTDSSTGASDLTIFSDGKDNSSIVTTTAGKETAAYISLNGATYVKDEDTGTWTKYAAANDGSTTNNPASDFKLDGSDITNNGKTSYKSLGKEACGSLTCYKYQIVDTDAASTTQTVWFDTKSYQLQRYSTKDAESSSDLTFTWQSVTIAVPSPVKDFSATTE